MVELLFVSSFDKCFERVLSIDTCSSESVLVCEPVGSNVLGVYFTLAAITLSAMGCSNRVTRWFPDKTFLTAETDFSY
jgi:hypothetical protein